MADTVFESSPTASPGYAWIGGSAKGEGMPWVAKYINKDERRGWEPLSDYDGSEPCWLGGNAEEGFPEFVAQALNERDTFHKLSHNLLNAIDDMDSMIRLCYDGLEESDEWLTVMEAFEDLKKGS